MNEQISYGFWEQLERSYAGYETRAEVVSLGIPTTEVLILAHQDVSQPAHEGEAWRNLRRMGVIVNNTEYLYGSSVIDTTVDTLGFTQPTRGVFVRKDTVRLSDERVMARSYLPANEVYPSDYLTDASSRYLSFAYAGVSAVLTYLDGAQGGSWPWPGSAIVRQREIAFAWVENGIGSEFDPQREGVWSPGRAGPYERVMMGSGDLEGSNDANWLIYALGRFLIVEFWRDRKLLATRALDCKDLPRKGAVRSEYVIAFGYDFNVGQVSLGVVRKDGPTAIAHTTWTVPELWGFGYDPESLNLGGSVVSYGGGHTANRTSWGLIKPIGGAFSSEAPLTPGFLTSLAERM